MSPLAPRSGDAAADVAGVADAPAAPPADPRTWVELVWIEGRLERWIRFGAVAGEVILDRRRRRVAFRPDEVFAFVRWAANEVGTVQSRIDVLQAAGPGAALTTVPGVTPGGLSLLPRPYSLARHRAWRLRRELGGC